MGFNNGDCGELFESIYRALKGFSAFIHGKMPTRGGRDVRVEFLVSSGDFGDKD